MYFQNREVCGPETLYEGIVKETSVHMKNIMELNNSVIKRFEILLWLFGTFEKRAPGLV